MLLGILIKTYFGNCSFRALWLTYILIYNILYMFMWCLLILLVLWSIPSLISSVRITVPNEGGYSHTVCKNRCVSISGFLMTETHSKFWLYLPISDAQRKRTPFIILNFGSTDTWTRSQPSHGTTFQYYG